VRPGPPDRVVVTGVGAVSAWGWGRDELWSGLCSGKTAIQGFSRFDHRDFRTHVAAQVPPPPDDLPRGFRGWRRWCWAERFGAASVAEALNQAGLPRRIPELNAAVVFGSSTGGMLETETFYACLRGAAEGRARLGDLASQQINAPGDAVAREFAVSGPVCTTSTACVSGASAIGHALDAVRTGEVELAIAGAADSLCRITYGGFNSLRSVDERPCIPFRKERDGLTVGEGAAALVLESLDRAIDRGAAPLAELIDHGASNDAHHMTAPHPQGAGARAALERACHGDRGLPARISFINAHGTGTPHNDRAEWEALRGFLGERAGSIPVTCTKGSIGHLLGATGAIEAVAVISSLQHRLVYPSAGEGAVDPATPVRLVTDRPMPIASMDVAVSVNLGFGGSNTALLFSAWNGS